MSRWSGDDWLRRPGGRTRGTASSQAIGVLVSRRQPIPKVVLQILRVGSQDELSVTVSQDQGGCCVPIAVSHAWGPLVPSPSRVVTHSLSLSLSLVLGGLLSGPV